ncbi:MAG: oligosaccharide flippase family protein [Ktedonobacteraceae bacterium]
MPFIQTEKIPAPPVERQNTTKLATPPPSKLEIPDFTIDDDPEFEKRSTFPMMVLKGISAQQGKPEPEMKSEVSGAAGAAGLVGFGNILGSILKYGSAFLIQYGFGPGGFGLYTLCLSLVNLVSAIFNLGLDDAMVRYVAIYRGKQQTKSLRGLLLFCTTLAGLAGITGALLLLYFTPSLVSSWIALKQHQVANKDTLNRAVALLQVMAPVIPLMTMQVMWFAGLRGFKAFKWRVLTTNFLQPLLQIILLGLVLVFFRSKDGITAVAVVLFISTLLNTVLNMYFLFREVSRVATPDPVRYEVREWLTFATLNFLTTIIDTVLDSIDTILLALFGVPNVQLGQYGAAMKLSNFIQMPLLSLSSIFAPTIAELHSKGEKQKLESMFKVVTKWSITFSLPLFLIMVIFSPYVLALPGPGFESAWPLLIAFAVGSMINAGTGTVGYMLLMTGYQRLSFLNSLVAVAVNIGLGILLTPRYGAIGTAVSTGLAICALNFMRVLQVRIFLKMHPWRLDIVKPIGAGLISSVLIGGVLYLLYFSHIRSSVKLGHAILSIQLLLIPVFLAIYAWLLTRFKGSPEDEIVLKAIRKKFLRGKGKKKRK